MPIDPNVVVRELGLAAHPEGGWYRELFRSPHRVVRADGATRSALTFIWFLLDAGQHSAWHRVAGADETWHWVDGGPVELSVIERDGRAWRVTLGARTDGHVPSAIVPADAWQAARPVAEAALVQCAVAPGFDFADFAMLRDLPEELAALRARSSAAPDEAML
jgi:predicted cupin superfamily sugar epimerase